MRILSIETSCDETAIAVLEAQNGRFNIVSNLVSSQVKIHQKYGGIVPEVAARKHVEVVIPLLRETFEKLKNHSVRPKSCTMKPLDSSSTPRLRLEEARGFQQYNTSAMLPSGPRPLRVEDGVCDNKEIQQSIDIIAVTTGPGLITSLMVGVETAKTLAYVWQKPLVAVNHLEAHIYANWIDNSDAHKIKFPALCLIVSGGHTQLVLMKNHGKYKIVGQTLDDAAGEAFDKVAKIMGLGYPGGPIISKLARKGHSGKFNLPRPMLDKPNFDFSFSGLKTSVLYKIKKMPTPLTEQDKADMAREFEQAVADVLVDKTTRAAGEYNAKTILLAGGVAANKTLRQQMKEKINKKLPTSMPRAAPRGNFYLLSSNYCTDNAAMIAAAAYFHARKKEFTPIEKVKIDPNWQL